MPLVKIALRWLACGILAMLLALLLWNRGVRPLGGTDPREQVPAHTDPGELALETGQATARISSATEPRPAGNPRSVDRADVADLIARLRAVSRAYATSDVETLQVNLEGLLEDPRDAILVLELLRDGGLGEDSGAMQGAVITIIAAVNLYNQPGWVGPAECGDFLGFVLEALPRVPMPWLSDLVTGLVEARAGDRPILGLAYLPRILALRAEHPDLAPVLSLLLENVADELKVSGGYEELYSILLGETRDPTTVGISLSALLASQPEDFLPLAEEMYAHADDDPELAGAITQAIAASAPVDMAAAALARMTDGTQVLEFLVLGTREGALEALSSEYSALVAQGDHPQARTMLVAGMAAEREEVLLGIAETDSDARVRAQAFLTGSLGREVGPGFVRALREAHVARGNGQRGIAPDASVAIAENVLRGSPGEPRDAARKLLLEIAGDESIADRARWSAVAAVRPWVPSGTLRGLFIGGRAVE